MRAAIVAAMAMLGPSLAIGCAPNEPRPTVAQPSPAPALPPRTCPTVLRIDTDSPGASALEVEMQRTTRYEAALATLPGVDRISSQTREGRATIWLEATPDEPPDFGHGVLPALAGLDTVPQDALSPRMTVVEPMPPRFVVIVRGPEALLNDAAAAVETTLLSTPGVTSAEGFGTPETRLSVRVDPRRLATYGVSVDAVAQAVNAMNIEPARLGATRPRDDKPIEALEHVVLAVLDGSPLHLRDVATLELAADPHGPQAFAATSPVRGLLVGATDRKAVERALAHVAMPADVSYELGGQLQPRACATPGVPPRLDGDFDVLELRGPDADTMRALLHQQAPASDDVVWLLHDVAVAEPEANAPLDPITMPIQALVPVSSPRRDALLAWIASTAAVELIGHYGPGRDHLTIWLRGQDHETLGRAARDLITAAAAEHLTATTSADTDVVDLQIDDQRAAAHGLTTRDLMVAVRHATMGISAGMLTVGGRSVPITLRVDDESTEVERSDAQQLKTIAVPTASGASVPLGDLAELRAARRPAQRLRRDGEPARVVRVWLPRDEVTSATLTLAPLLRELEAAHPDVRASLDH